MLLSRFMLVATLHTHKTRQSAARTSIAGQAYVRQTAAPPGREKRFRLYGEEKKIERSKEAVIISPFGEDGRLGQSKEVVDVSPFGEEKRFG
jgi:hypothetical protein